MFLADAHCDTLYSIAVLGASPESCAVTEERLARGGVGIQTFAMFAGPKGAAGAYSKNVRSMLDSLGKTGIPMLRGDLPAAPPDTPHGVLSIEGGEALEGSLEVLREFDARARLRMIALTWNNENEIAHPARDGAHGGLKPFGRALLAEMDRRGILADVSHLNEAGFWDVCEQSSLPPIASHSNCRWLCPVPRNLRKDQVRAIIEREGFIGVNFYPPFLTRKQTARVEEVFRHIDAICEMGGERIVGFGSDFDGIDRCPVGLETPADFPMLIDFMRARGYREAQIENIAGMNFWRILKYAEEIRAN
ncbi:MAG: dipeptidase [Christensenellales bacterium]|jgi:membrane dipeptidase